MAGFTKLFSSIVDSTIWRESKETKIVWITMLAKADRRGIVEAALPGLADAARVSVDECRAAMQVLSSPDPDSRSKEYEGRRIKEIDGGFQILNYAKYREKLSADERREYMRSYMVDYRGKLTVNKSKLCKLPLAQAEAEAEAEARGNGKHPPIAAQRWQIKRDIDRVKDRIKEIRVESGQEFDGTRWHGVLPVEKKQTVEKLKVDIKTLQSQFDAAKV